MSDDARRIRTAEDVLRYFMACTKSVQLYAPEHPIVARAVEQLAQTLERAHAEAPAVVIGIVDGQVIVDGIPLADVHGAADAAARLRAFGIERIAIGRGVVAEELLEFVRGLAAAQAKADGAGDDQLAALATPHVHVGRLRLQRRGDAGPDDMRAMQHAYQDAVAGAEALWEQSLAEGGPDPAMATRLVDGLASAVGQNRRAMMALSALYRYDNYTFTHMVNVSVLTMAQARSLGIDGTLLRQFGLAGLMHDIGKIKTPAEILKKPDRLTEGERAIMMKHPVDGAEMLRRRLELPPLAAVVAFEHHLKVNGTGYPGGVARPELNLATQLCQHRGRLRRDAVQAELPAGLPDRPDHGRPPAERRLALRTAARAALRPAHGDLPRRQPRASRRRDAGRGAARPRAGSIETDGARDRRPGWRTPAQASRRRALGRRRPGRAAAPHRDAGRPGRRRHRPAALPRRSGGLTPSLLSPSLSPIPSPLPLASPLSPIPSPLSPLPCPLPRARRARLTARRGSPSLDASARSEVSCVLCDGSLARP